MLKKLKYIILFLLIILLLSFLVTSFKNINSLKKESFKISKKQNQLLEKTKSLEKEIDKMKTLNKILVEENNKLRKELVDKETKKEIENCIDKESSIQMVKKYLEENKIEIPYPEYKLGYFGNYSFNGRCYFAIRVYYSDINDSSYTKTISRYYVDMISGKVLKEDLYSNKLYDELKK